MGMQINFVNPVGIGGEGLGIAQLEGLGPTTSPEVQKHQRGQDEEEEHTRGRHGNAQLQVCAGTAGRVYLPADT